MPRPLIPACPKQAPQANIQDSSTHTQSMDGNAMGEISNVNQTCWDMDGNVMLLGAAGSGGRVQFMG